MSSSTEEINENKIIQFICKHKFAIFFAIITILSLVLRSRMFEYVSDDYKDFLDPWFNQLKDGGGLFALKESIGNYNAPYLTIMALLTYIPIPSLISIKLVSVVFDYVCAFAVMNIIKTLLKDNKNTQLFMLIGYTAVVCLPTVFINSACWGQADSIYTAFVLISLMYLIKQKYTRAFVFLGIAFSFKLQIVFILPLYILVYLSERKFSIFNFILVPVMNFVMCIPAMLFGKGIMDCMSVYINQTGEYSQFLTMNFPNVYSLFIPSKYTNAPNLIQNPNDIISKIGIIITMVIFAIIAFMVFRKKVKFDSKAIIEFGIWSILIATFFLPHMHDRYLYMADILGLLYLIYNKRKYYIPILIEFISLYTYIYYLSGTAIINIQWVSGLNLILFIIYSKNMWKTYFVKTSETQKLVS